MGKMSGVGWRGDQGERHSKTLVEREREGTRVSEADEGEEEEVHKRKQAAAVNDKKQRRGTTGN